MIHKNGAMGDTITNASDKRLPLFFPVSQIKLVVMSVATAGFYEIYWFYRNWKLVKLQALPGISPFWRSFFSYFFCYSMFREIRCSASERGVTSRIYPFLHTLLWIGLFISWKLPDPYSLLSTLSVLPLLPIQKTVQLLNNAHDPTFDTNSRFSKWNIAGIVIGGLMLILVIIGTLMPKFFAD
jgi:hypothetical protein